MLNATESFFAPLEEWISAIRVGDFARARTRAESLIRAGELLTIHPDFARCFKTHGGGDPKHALFQLCQFLMCATDGRAVVLKQWVQDNKPPVSG